MRTANKQLIKSESGSSLIIVLIVCMALAAIAAASLTASGQRTRRQNHESAQQKALAAAEAGIDKAIALGNDGQFNALLTDESMNIATMTILGAQDSVTVTRLADTVNGNATTKTLRVVSSGSYDKDTKKIIGFIRQVTTTIQLAANLPVADCGLMLSDPFASASFNGSSFVISGSDKNINGSPGPNTPLWGLGLGPQSNGQSSNLPDFVTQIPFFQENNIQGLGSTPSVANVGSVPVSNIISLLAPSAGVTLTNPSNFSGSMGSYLSNLPQLTSIVGDITISGPSSGYGILIVNGNLTVAEDWNYIGMVFVNGQLTFDEGGSTKKMTGATFVAGNLQDLTSTGSITLQYSTEAINLIMTWINSFSSTTTTPYFFVSSADA